MSESYEVLHNTAYGGFHFPQDVVMEAFTRYPPGTPLGDKLFRPDKDHYITEDQEPDPEWATYMRITGYETFIGEFKQVSYRVIRTKSPEPGKELTKTGVLTKGDGVFYRLSMYPNWFWRSCPEIIALMKEFKYIGKHVKNTTYALTSIPVDYAFDIDEYDGMETVFPKCPTEQILQDLLDAIRTGKKEGFHPLTQKLLAGQASIQEILHPRVKNT
jgi:hypothetical protein